MSKKPLFIYSIIPIIIPNCIVVAIFSLLTIIAGKTSRKTRAMHHDENQRILSDGEKIFYNRNAFIENQEKWEKVRFGSHRKSNMAYSGCEIIGTYNVLTALGVKNVNIPELISYFEKSGAALRGGFGVAPAAPCRYFKKNGYKVQSITSKKKERIDYFGTQHETFLVTFYWDRENIMKQLHTVNISKGSEGFWVHNVYIKNKEGNFAPKGPYKTLGDAIYGLSAKAQPLIIYGIDR